MSYNLKLKNSWNELSSFFEKQRLLVPETREMFLALMKDFRRIDDFLRYKERVLAGYQAEISLKKIILCIDRFYNSV